MNAIIARRVVCFGMLTLAFAVLQQGAWWSPIVVSSLVMIVVIELVAEKSHE